MNKKSIKTIIILLIIIVVIYIFFSIKSKREEIYHVGILSGLDYVAEMSDGFKSKMAELGYFEGENIVYDLQKTNFDITAYQNILKKFIKNKVDLIFVFPTEASLEAKTATQETNIPVLFSFANIEDVNLIENIRHPGGNITGVRYPGPDLAVKRFEVMKELVPRAKQILIPYQRDYPIVASQLKVLSPVAKAANITLIELPADNAAELQNLLEKYISSGINFDAIMALAEPLFVTPDAFTVIAKFAYKYKIPFGGAYMMIDNYGSIFGVNINIFETGKQAAILADKILKGTPAGTIPVISSESFFQINYNVAQELDVIVPEGLLNTADEIIH
jgi:putative ABC transport system substrate-binding protein